MERYSHANIDEWLKGLARLTTGSPWEVVGARQTGGGAPDPMVHYFSAWTYLAAEDDLELDADDVDDLGELLPFIGQTGVERPRAEAMAFAGWTRSGRLVLPWDYLGLLNARQHNLRSWVKDREDGGTGEVCRIRVLDDGAELIELNRQLLRHLLAFDRKALVRTQHLHAHSRGPYTGQVAIAPWPGAVGTRRVAPYPMPAKHPGFDEATVLDAVRPTGAGSIDVILGCRARGEVAFPYALDDDGNVIEGTSSDAPGGGYTYVRFKPTVLDRYRHDSARFSYDETAGIVHGPDFWIDATHDDDHTAVTALLVDLNRLPLDEQHHWRAQMVAPVHDQADPRRARRDMLERLEDGFAEFPSFASDLKQAIGAVNAVAERRWGAPLIKPLAEPERTSVWAAIRVADPEAALDFGQQMGLLRKVLGDSVDTKLSRRFWGELRDEPVDTKLGSLTVLGGAVEPHVDDETIAASVGVLRDIQALGSTSAHRGNAESPAIARLGLSGLAADEQWRRALRAATAALGDLAGVLSEAPERTGSPEPVRSRPSCHQLE